MRGTTSSDVDQVIALVNQGRDGVARCEPNRSVELPQFAFDCRMREDDSWAWIEVLKRNTRRSSSDRQRSSSRDAILESRWSSLEERRARTPALPSRHRRLRPRRSEPRSRRGQGRHRHARAQASARERAARRSLLRCRGYRRCFHTTDVVALRAPRGVGYRGGTIRDEQFLRHRCSTGAKKHHRAGSTTRIEASDGAGFGALLQPDTRQVAVGPTPLRGEAAWRRHHDVFVLRRRGSWRTLARHEWPHSAPGGWGFAPQPALQRPRPRRTSSARECRTAQPWRARLRSDGGAGSGARSWIGGPHAKLLEACRSRRSCLLRSARGARRRHTLPPAGTSRRHDSASSTSSVRSPRAQPGRREEGGASTHHPRRLNRTR